MNAINHFWLSSVSWVNRQVLRIELGISPIGMNHSCGITCRINAEKLNSLDAYWIMNTNGPWTDDEKWELLIDEFYEDDEIVFTAWANIGSDELWAQNNGGEFYVTITNGQAIFNSFNSVTSVIPQNHCFISSIQYRIHREAIEQFDRLLRAQSTEIGFQKLFEKFPYILTETLPIRYDALYSQLRLKSGRPDFVFVRNGQTSTTGDYGVIELKRPSDSIICRYAAQIKPSGKLVSATTQVKSYLDDLEHGQFLSKKDFFVVGNRQHAFIIIGDSSQLVEQCKNEIQRNKLHQLLPENFHLFTYDEIFSRFSLENPPTLRMLRLNKPSRSTRQASQTLVMKWYMGMHARPTCMLVQLFWLFRGNAYVEKDNQRVNGRSILTLLPLGIQCGEKYTVTVTGPECKEVLRMVSYLNDKEFFCLDFELFKTWLSNIERTFKEK